MDLAAAEQVLKDQFGLSRFRIGQAEIIEAMLKEHSLLAVMPTGAGKSLCYQLPALLSTKMTLVISPLIALMQDQVDALIAKGIKATYLNSQVDPFERRIRIESAIQGDYDLLYLAPERLSNSSFIEDLKQMPIDRIAVDEAHCVSQWGHDFRPDYREIAVVAKELGVKQIAAFTATATKEVRDDIVELLGLKQKDKSHKVFVYGFKRDNLHLYLKAVDKMRHKVGHIIHIAQNIDGSGIIYCSTRKNVEKLCATLEEHGFSVGAYHGGLPDQERIDVQQRFMNNELRLMVATNAFGLGIDKADIRFVIHYDVPGSLEAYYQEAGRAGRDGQPATCVLFFNYADIRVHQFFIDQIGENGDLSASRIKKLQAIERAKLRTMVSYCYADECRQGLILKHFGEKDHASCGLCDFCEDKTPLYIRERANVKDKKKNSIPLSDARELDADEFIIVQKLLSAYARSKGRLSKKRMMGLVKATAHDMDDDLRQSKSWGILKDYSEHFIEQLTASFIEAELICLHPSRSDVYLLTKNALDILRGESSLHISFPCETKKGKKRKEKKLSKTISLNENDKTLFYALRNWRKEEAEKRNIPAFIIAHDSLLERVAESRPQSIEELLAIKGIGNKKAEDIGDSLLAEIKAYSA